nr:MmgE/PrpD family protein [Novosphingobium panipatense]
MTDSHVVPASVLLNQPVSGWLDRWATFAVEQRTAALPRAVLDRTRLVLLDSIGVIAAGMQETDVAALVARRAQGGPASVIGSGAFASEGEAAFLGGLAGTTLELDEGNQFARGHPAIHVVPAVLAAARDCDGMALLRALVLGYEIGSRIGIASRLRVTMHPHGTWGTVGAAVAAASLAGADSAGMANTINIAAGLGIATSRRTMLEGATVRNSFAGLSNQLGLLAWDMACAGIKGEADAVATVYGGIVAEDFSPDAMVEDLGKRWEIARNYFKMHAACRYTHASLDVLQTLVSGEGGRIDPDRIESIDVDTYIWTAQLDGPAPRTMLAGKFSIPFAIATALVHGEASPEAFRPKALENPAILDLASRVRVREDSAMTSALPAERPARLAIALKDGRRLTGETRVNRGDTETPYAPDEILAKFRSLAHPVWGEAVSSAIERAVADLENAESCRSLMELLATPPSMTR